MTTTSQLPPSSPEHYDFAREYLAGLADHYRDQLRAQADDVGVSLLDLTAHFVSRIGEP